MNSKVLLMTIAFVASTNAQQPTTEQRLAELEKRVAALEQAQAAAQRSKPPPAERIVAEGASPLKLESWDFRVVRGKYAASYEITLDFKNSGTKEIKLIDGSVIFKDLLGEKVYGIKITPDQRIAVGKPITDKGSYSINSLIEEQARMARMKKEDIQAILVIRKLVFSDNSIVEYAP